MNNQNTMNENKEQETKTRVLSDTERRDFDGILYKLNLHLLKKKKTEVGMSNFKTMALG